ncbi:MAG: polysaccharide lyase beta-sandwich domain-containing protein [Micrococcaceae bacterium]|nr:polysaccharide lyase beta-sandwich domain-containing protein [Micrococcaceae bacterium]
MNWTNLEFNRRTLIKVGSVASAGAAFALSAAPAQAAGARVPMAPAAPGDVEAKALALQPPTFLFEKKVPEQVTEVSGAEPAISDEQAIIGKHSLRWDYSAGSVLQIDAALDAEDSRIPEDDETKLGSRSTFGLWIYNSTARQGTLRLEFGRQGSKDAWCDLHLDFTGWRTVWIRLAQDLEGTPRRDMDTLRFVAPSSGSGTLFLDQLVLNMSMRTDHPMRSEQAPFVNPEADTAQNAHWLALLKFQELQDAQAPAPVTDATLLADVSTVKSRYLEAYLTGGGATTGSQVADLTAQLAKLGIPERSTSGPATPVLLNQQAIFPPQIAPELAALAGSAKLRTLTDLMQKIARAWERADATRRPLVAELYVRAVLHLRRVGWAKGSSQGSVHHLGYNIRGYYDSVFIMKDVLQDEGLLEEARADIDWFVGLGRVLERPLRRDGIMDIYNTNVRGLVAAAMLRETPGEQAAWLSAVRDFLDVTLQPSDGLQGGIKADGSGFHHVGFYPAYSADGLSGLAPMVMVLGGTSFRLSEAAHSLLKKAVLGMRTFANKFEWSLTVCNRHPKAGQTLKLDPFQWLFQAGTPDGKKALDPELGAAFLRLLPEKQSSIHQRLAAKLAATGVTVEDSPTGHWTYNYGALGVHRREDWSVTVRGHNRYLWSSETYENANIYGRYGTYGQINVQSTGDPITLLDSGFSQEGWDWGRFPGTTAIHKPVDDLFIDLGLGVEIMPLSDSRFGGATNIDGRHGLFAMDLHEIPSWDPSHRARKSVFLFDERVIAVGTGIENNDRRNETGTTLFQSHLAATSEPPYIESNRPVADYPIERKSRKKSKHAQWLADGKGNGYYIPAKQHLGIERSTQKSKDQSSGEPTSGDFATAWLSHGTKPRSGSYEYAMLIGRTPQQTAAFAKAMGGRRAPYEVLEARSDRHAVRDRETGITGYAVFEAGHGFEGDIEGVDTPSLLMTRREKNRLVMSVTDPDLRLYSGKDPDQYDAKGRFVGGVLPYVVSWRENASQAHTLTVKVKGSWKLAEKVDGVKVTSRKGHGGHDHHGGRHGHDHGRQGRTEIAVRTRDGLPVQFSLARH